VSFDGVLERRRHDVADVALDEGSAFAFVEGREDFCEGGGFDAFDFAAGFLATEDVADVAFGEPKEGGELELLQLVRCLISFEKFTAEGHCVLFVGGFPFNNVDQVRLASIFFEKKLTENECSF